MAPCADGGQWGHTWRGSGQTCGSPSCTRGPGAGPEPWTIRSRGRGRRVATSLCGVSLASHRAPCFRSFAHTPSLPSAKLGRALRGTALWSPLSWAGTPRPRGVQGRGVGPRHGLGPQLSLSQHPSGAVCPRVPSPCPQVELRELPTPHQHETCTPTRMSARALLARPEAGAT